ncbi:toprim domain-containing protein [uncultured Faecalicoccus sp.]|uniref:toprim domain-containing protein n=1 Tax=uncultured Faecalicoccus sp. TaxID=1971760 RepID=UPI002586FF6B|nr:toprim domain-containing protein [uncultured Faecalicoccus sp.]
MFIEPEKLAELKKIDLLSYLFQVEPERLKKISRNTFCIRDHDSLHISNGLWHWQSVGIGGRSALDFLIKVEGFSFKEAVKHLQSLSKDIVWEDTKEQLKPKERNLLFPQKDENNFEAAAYLKRRGIDEELIQNCIQKELIFQSFFKNRDTGDVYKQVAFVGFDHQKSIPKYINLRGIHNDYKGDSFGSNKAFSFLLRAKNPSNVVHVCEASIDVLSYASLMKLYQKDYETIHILSLGGVQIPQNDSKISCKTPIALEQFLRDFPEVNSLVLHLDNDRAGRLATKTIQKNLTQYHVRDSPPKYGKDVNDDLKTRLGIEKYPRNPYQKRIQTR